MIRLYKGRNRPVFGLVVIYSGEANTNFNILIFMTVKSESTTRKTTRGQRGQKVIKLRKFENRTITKGNGSSAAAKIVT